MHFAQTYLLIASVCALFGQSIAIKCWNCRSDTDVKCNDPFDNATLSIMDCQFHLPHIVNSVCKKTIQRVNGKMVTTRDCAVSPINGRDDCKSELGNENKMIEFCEYCSDRDGCNGSNFVSYAVYLSICMPVLKALFAFKTWAY